MTTPATRTIPIGGPRPRRPLLDLPIRYGRIFNSRVKRDLELAQVLGIVEAHADEQDAGAASPMSAWLCALQLIGRLTA